MPGVAPATHTIRHSQRQLGDTTPNQSVSVPKVHVCRYPTTEERQRRSWGSKHPHKMRAGGTRITPWLMLLTGFRCRYASATLALWFWYALTYGCGLRRFVVSWCGNCGGCHFVGGRGGGWPLFCGTGCGAGGLTLGCLCCVGLAL